MVFAIRGDIESALSSDFHLSGAQMGLIWTPAFWGFTLAIFACGVLVDLLGMKFIHALSSIGYILGVIIVLLAPKPELADGVIVESIFGHTGTTMLYIGFLAMGLSQGLVEGVINPLAATIYSDKKGKMLNILHAWWPGGMVIGGLLAFAMTQADIGWKLKLGTIVVPALIYLVMCILRPYPKTERVAANLSFLDMVKATIKPLFILLFFGMLLSASVELGPDQWFPSLMKNLTGIEGILFLVYTAGLMFILRFFCGGIVQRFSPFAVLFVCSILVGLGLFWLGSLNANSSIMIAFMAATVFGVGKSFLWPTMLGVVSECFPKGGALAMNLVGGAGMLAIAITLPIMGAEFDELGAGSALKSMSGITLFLIVLYAAIHSTFQYKGGYKAEKI